ncbi:MAG: hypothetical protein M3Q16_08920 [Pseudomonadota bacterium]|nr:hypothetical protein [Pseudomonadota bacterium]
MVRIKSLKRKSGIFAPRVAVRPQSPGYLRWLIIAVLTAVALGLSWGMYDAGRKFSGSDKNETRYEQDRLSQLNKRLEQDNDELRIKAASLERQLQMDVAASEDVTKQVKVLGDENTRLKEDLAFFQNLLSLNGKTEQRVSIGRLKLERGQLPGEYHYSLLLVQGGQRTKDFQGSLEFVVNFRQNGEKMVTPLGSENPSKTFNVSFKFYQRVEKSFHMPPDATVESMQVKVFEKGAAQAKVVQTVNLS